GSFFPAYLRPRWRARGWGRGRLFAQPVDRAGLLRSLFLGGRGLLLGAVLRSLRCGRGCARRGWGRHGKGGLHVAFVLRLARGLGGEPIGDRGRFPFGARVRGWSRGGRRVFAHGGVRFGERLLRRRHSRGGRSRLFSLVEPIQRSPGRSGAASASPATCPPSSPGRTASGSTCAQGTSTKARFAARGCGSVSSGSLESTSPKVMRSISRVRSPHRSTRTRPWASSIL